IPLRKQGDLKILSIGKKELCSIRKKVADGSDLETYAKELGVYPYILRKFFMALDWEKLFNKGWSTTKIATKQPIGQY
ncbi:MAG: hypothetical protein ACE5GI_06280, partial [Candidatus Aminicenantales bacterium]